MRFKALAWIACAWLLLGGGAASVGAVDGEGVALNLRMARMAEASPLYRHARHGVERHLAALHDADLARESREALLQPGDCIRHRIGMGASDQKRIVIRLKAAGFLPADMPMEQARSGLFPPLAGEGSACPHLDWPVLTAAGGNSHSHHSWPGGLAVHTAGNLARGARFARAWPGVDGDGWRLAILWHDWAKALVLPWQGDGSTRPELSVAGTGAHHVLALAEAMRRDFPARQIADQACAHALPGRDGQPVARWLQAAAIIADVPPASVPMPAMTPACRINFEADQGWVHDDAALMRAERRVHRMVERCNGPHGFAFEAQVRNAILARLGTNFRDSRVANADLCNLRP